MEKMTIARFGREFPPYWFLDLSLVVGTAKTKLEFKSFSATPAGVDLLNEIVPVVALALTAGYFP